jgi:hypothetical protein
VLNSSVEAMQDSVRCSGSGLPPLVVTEFFFFIYDSICCLTYNALRSILCV